jgi:hypothetical protein
MCYAARRMGTPEEDEKAAAEVMRRLGVDPKTRTKAAPQSLVEKLKKRATAMDGDKLADAFKSIQPEPKSQPPLQKDEKKK